MIKSNKNYLFETRREGDLSSRMKRPNNLSSNISPSITNTITNDYVSSELPFIFRRFNSIYDINEKLHQQPRSSSNVDEIEGGERK